MKRTHAANSAIVYYADRPTKVPTSKMLRKICIISLILLSPPATGAPLDECRTLVKKGEYASAEKKLAGTGRKGKADALLLQGQIQLETGRYKQAIKNARKAARGKQKAAALTLMAEAQIHAGKRAAATKTLKTVVTKFPNHLRARALLGRLYYDTGKWALARSIFDQFYDDYDAEKIDSNSGEGLSYVAMACHYTDNFRDASDTYADAAKADPSHIQTFIQWAKISLEKYEAGYAEKHYKKALTINPHHAEALVGMAQVKLEQSNDVAAAEKLLTHALKTNPASIDARVVKARILIDNEQNTAAELILNQALKNDSDHLGALTMLATSRYLRDDTKGYKALQKKVLALNPRYTKFFRTMVKLAVRHHRYEESIALSREAIAIDPQDWYSLADMGLNYLRLGKDKEGLKYLRQAWKGDQYNVRNFNTLNLYDDIIAKQYVFIKSKHFRLRVHKKEKDFLERITVPLLERAYQTYAKKYGFEPQTPIVIELFSDPQHYAVRTVGLPGLGVLGVCFGQVITSTSPANGRFNWGQVLWHELNHIFTIQLSRSRVPRWLTEGLADREPELIRREWKRENDFDIYKALRSGRLHGLNSMNSAFTRAKNIRDMVVAYYQGSLMANYLVKYWGMKGVVAALKDYGRGARTETILPKITGLSLEELDLRFRQSELKRLSHYNTGWYVDPQDFQDLDKIQARFKSATGTKKVEKAQAELAMALLYARKMKEANDTAEAVLKKNAKNKLAIFVKAQLTKKSDKAEAIYKSLLTVGGDGFQIRLRLGALALKRKALDEGYEHLSKAKLFDPERKKPYQLLLKAYRKTNNRPKTIGELKGLVKLQQQAFAPISELVSLLEQEKDWAGVRRYGMQAYFIQPASVRLHKALAKAYENAAPKVDLDRAAWHLEVALLTAPKKPIPLRLALSKIYVQQGKKAAARKELKAILATDGTHNEAKDLLRKVAK
jgi:cellulose synthase operon protein C